MYALQVALALAVSMLIFSTLSTMVVEIINKALNIRRFGLKKMLASFYNKVVKQRIKAMLAREGSSVEDMPEFVRKLTAMSGGSHTLTTFEFIRRLADTEIGKRFAERAESELDDLIDDIVERYEDYGRRASLIFRHYSQVATVVVSIILALSLNINVVTIFRTFQNDKELTATISGQAEQAMAAYQLQAELLKVTTQKDKSKIESIDNEFKELEESMEKFREKVKTVKELGLPIGWKDDKFLNPENFIPYGGFVWFLTTLLTGLLIGLGGPFWFEMVKRLSVISKVTGALIREPPAKGETDGTAKAQKGAAASIPEDSKAAFKLIIRTNRIIDNSIGDVSDFLGPRGLRL